MAEGGLRDRFIIDSFREMVRAALDDLSWFNLPKSEGGDRKFKHRVSLVGDAAGEADYELDPAQPVEPNKIGIMFGQRVTEDAECGSDLSVHRWTVFIDIFAESNVLGRHLQGDIEAIVRGRLEGTSRDGQDAFPVHDWEDEDHPVLFWCDIESIQTDNPPSAAGNNWFTVEFDVVDTR